MQLAIIQTAYLVGDCGIRVTVGVRHNCRKISCKVIFRDKNNENNLQKSGKEDQKLITRQILTNLRLDFNLP